MKKLKLLGSLAAMLLLPSVVSAQNGEIKTILLDVTQAHDATIYASGAGSFDSALGEWVYSGEASTGQTYPTAGVKYLGTFKVTDPNENSTGDYTFSFKSKYNNTSSTARPKFGATNASTNNKLQLVRDCYMTITTPSNNMYIREVKLNYVASATSAFSSNDFKNNSYTNGTTVRTFSGVKSDDLTSVTIWNSSTSTTAVKIASIELKVYVEPMSADQAQTIPYTANLASDNDMSIWTFYDDAQTKNSDDEYVFPWLSRSEKGILLADIDENQYPNEHSGWSVSPKVQLAAGKYTVTLGLEMHEPYGPAKETIGFTCSKELPGASTPLAADPVVILDSDGYEDDDYDFNYIKPAKVTFEVAEAGEYYIGIHNLGINEQLSEKVFSYPWSYTYLQSFLIEEYVEHNPAWEDVRVRVCDKNNIFDRIILTGNYDVIKNEECTENATYTFGTTETTLNLDPSCTDKTATFTGFRVFTGDYATVTVTIPEGYFVDDEGNPYPAYSEELTINYNELQGDVVYTLSVADNILTVQLYGTGDDYTYLQKTARFNLTLIDAEDNNPVSNVEVGDFTMEVGQSYNTLKFELPQLPEGTYKLELAPYSLRTCINHNSETNLIAWALNKNAYKSNVFTIAPVDTSVTHVEEGVTYRCDEGNAVITDGTNATGVVVIPSYVYDEVKDAYYDVTEIAENAFFNGNDITEVVIPSSVATIGANAFYSCSNLSEMFVDCENIEGFDVKAFSNINSTVKVHVPVGCKAAYDNKFGFNTIEANLVHYQEESHEIKDGYRYVCHEPLQNGWIDMTYKRTFNSDNWSSLFVAHSVAASSINGIVAELNSCYVNEDGAQIIVWKKVTGDLEPGMPYIFKPAETGEHTFTGSGAMAHNDTHVSKTVDDGKGLSVTLTGVFDHTDVYPGDGRFYLFNDGNFRPVGKNQKMGPFRVFLTFTAPQSASQVIYNTIIDHEGDTPTAIGEIEMEVYENGVCYDLNGNRVENPENGIYIINGQKVVVK